MLPIRVGKRIHIDRAFIICSVLLVASLSAPRIGGPKQLWMNGLYESFCIIVVFPIIVAMGAGDSVTGRFSTKLSHFLGDISFPLYITHYPLIYVYTAWVTRDNIPGTYGAAVGVLLVIASVLIAYACLKLYDKPVREWLKRSFLVKIAQVRPVGSEVV
jgi:peptidoglycan/LPS O-acetylase OafA/YrhL